MIPLANLAGHMNRVFSDIPFTFYRNGSQMSGIKTSPDISQSLEIGGFDEKIEFDIFARPSVFSSMPVEGEIWKCDNIDMKVVRIGKSLDGLLLKFSMGYARSGETIQ